MDECGMNPKSVSMHLSVLSSYCRYLVKQGKLKSNPVRLVKRPRTPKQLAKFYKNEEIELKAASLKEIEKAEAPVEEVATFY